MLTHIITGSLKFPLPYQGLGGYFRDPRLDQNTMLDSGKTQDILTGNVFTFGGAKRSVSDRECKYFPNSCMNAREP